MISCASFIVGSSSIRHPRTSPRNSILHRKSEPSTSTVLVQVLYQVLVLYSTVLYQATWYEWHARWQLVPSPGIIPGIIPKIDSTHHAYIPGTGARSRIFGQMQALSIAAKFLENSLAFGRLIYKSHHHRSSLLGPWFSQHRENRHGASSTTYVTTTEKENLDT